MQAATHALLGDWLLNRLNFKEDGHIVRGNVVSFPGGDRARRAGASDADEVNLMVTCPARDENGGHCWTVTTKDLLKVKGSGKLLRACCEWGD